MDLASLLTQIDDVLYTWLLIYLLAGSGIYFSIRTRFVQIRRFKDAMNCMLEKKDGDKGVSSFQALMIATASRVGTGNMAGVAMAIIFGGPGAAFWMWLMAVLGSASAFIESTLAQIYKKKEGDSFKGGPAYYIERALHARWLGIIFAISLIATFAFGFNGLQAYNIVSAFDVYVEDLQSSILPTVIGVILPHSDRRDPCRRCPYYFLFGGHNRKDFFCPGTGHGRSVYSDRTLCHHHQYHKTSGHFCHHYEGRP